MVHRFHTFVGRHVSLLALHCRVAPQRLFAPLQSLDAALSSYALPHLPYCCTGTSLCVQSDFCRICEYPRRLFPIVSNVGLCLRWMATPGLILVFNADEIEMFANCVEAETPFGSSRNNTTHHPSLPRKYIASTLRNRTLFLPAKQGNRPKLGLPSTLLSMPLPLPAAPARPRQQDQQSAPKFWRHLEGFYGLTEGLYTKPTPRIG